MSYFKICIFALANTSFHKMLCNFLAWFFDYFGGPFRGPYGPFIMLCSNYSWGVLVTWPEELQYCHWAKTSPNLSRQDSSDPHWEAWAHCHWIRFPLHRFLGWFRFRLECQFSWPWLESVWAFPKKRNKSFAKYSASLVNYQVNMSISACLLIGFFLARVCLQTQDLNLDCLLCQFYFYLFPILSNATKVYLRVPWVP